MATANSRCYYLSVAGALGGRMAIAGTQDILERQISSLARFKSASEVRIGSWNLGSNVSRTERVEMYQSSLEHEILCE